MAGVFGPLCIAVDAGISRTAPEEDTDVGAIIRNLRLRRSRRIRSLAREIDVIAGTHAEEVTRSLSIRTRALEFTGASEKAVVTAWLSLLASDFRFSTNYVDVAMPMGDNRT